jgi:DNA-binding transcriptional LysR family regulator
MHPFLPTRVLEYVVAVANELHFGRAAAKLHVSAPAITRQIRELEAKLGYQLFKRSTHEVSLTAAGAVFIAEIRKGLDCLERAIDLGAAASRGESEVLTVGYTPSLNPSVLWALRAAYAREAPGKIVEFESAYSVQQVEWISRGRLGAGLVALPIAGSGLRVRCIWREQLAIALPKGHELAKRKVIALNRLRDERFVWPARSVNPWVHQNLIASSAQLGLIPNIIQEVTTVSEALDLVAGAVGVALVKASLLTRLRLQGVAFRELEAPGLSWETAVAHRPDDRSESLRLFLGLLQAQSNCETA